MRLGFTPDDAESLCLSNFKKALEIVGKSNKGRNNIKTQ